MADLVLFQAPKTSSLTLTLFRYDNEIQLYEYNLF